MLARLPPSAELLQHYQNKLAQYEEEEAQLAARIEACAKLLDNSSRLEREVALRDSQIERLRQAVEDAGVQIHEGRKRLLQAEAENDRLRIRDIESQHKVAVLSRLCGKSNEEVALLAEKTTRLPSRFQDGKVGKYEERAQLKNRRSSQELMLEVEHLEQQVVEQEQLHRKQLQEEKKSRKKALKEADEDKAGLRARITSLQVKNQLSLTANTIFTNIFSTTSRELLLVWKATLRCCHRNLVQPGAATEKLKTAGVVRGRCL